MAGKGFFSPPKAAAGLAVLRLEFVGPDGNPVIVPPDCGVHFLFCLDEQQWKELAEWGWFPFSGTPEPRCLAPIE